MKLTLYTSEMISREKNIMFCNADNLCAATLRGAV